MTQVQQDVGGEIGTEKVTLSRFLLALGEGLFTSSSIKDQSQLYPFIHLKYEKCNSIKKRVSNIFTGTMSLVYFL